MNVSLYQAAAAMNANSRWQEMITQNLASSSVPGFRKQELSLEAVKAGFMPANAAQGSQYFTIPKANTATSFQQGDFQYTGDSHNVAIEGKGFFQVQLPNGTNAVTRDGEFQMTSKGQLVTKEGFAVMGEAGPLQLDPNNHGPLSVSNDGEISQGDSLKGKFKLTDYAKPELLTQISGSYFLADASKIQGKPSTSTLRQDYLEGSNTSVVTEMANMMTAMRSFEANQKIVQIQDDRIGKAISELGNPT